MFMIFVLVDSAMRLYSMSKKPEGIIYDQVLNSVAQGINISYLSL